MEARSELQRMALQLWLEGHSYFEIVDRLIDAVAVMALPTEFVLIDDEAQLEDWETEGRRHAARLNGEIP